MKILFQVSFPFGMGADRWIYDGYKNAFLDKGHQFFALTERDDLEKCLKRIKPDIFIIGLFSLIFYDAQKPITENSLKKIHQQGTKIFCGVGPEFKQEAKCREFLKKHLSLIDVFYTNYAPEVVQSFEKIFNKPCYFIPHAADTKIFFPAKPDKKFKCDLAFVGNKLPTKKVIFGNVLYPLCQKYDVRIYGPGWTNTDKALRLMSGFSRKLKIDWLTDFVNRKRVAISPENERMLYASAKICLNFHEYYGNGSIKGFSNEREFKIPASGGFQVSDYIPTMWRLFEPNKEIVMAKTPEEWFSKVEHYLTCEKERKKIQEAGTRKVLKEHTYYQRVDQIVELYKSLIL